MAKRSRQEKKSKTEKNLKITPQIHDEALAITNNVVKVSFTKQQRKEVQKAIEEGIAQFKRQYAAKQRDYNKQGKKTINSLKGNLIDSSAAKNALSPIANSGFGLQWLPWVLLGLSWLCFLFFIFIAKS